MQTTSSHSPKTMYLHDQKNNIKYIYDWDNEVKRYYEQKRLYHLEMANHFQMMGDHLKSEPNLFI
jgi:hypothetical protein